MKYFEIHEPYYALLAAEDEKKAAEVYCEVVTDDVDDTFMGSIKEVSRQYALGCVGDSVFQSKPELSVAEFVRDFDDRENTYLLFSRGLA
ncbi:hypothetical protein [Bacillus haynesii]|uniref:hypothetical protein n=1 Tax=Bacillus haynesii TaxID=1925021 RepID=UPI00227E4228|nr:hypothetical protein [Bacillus haynesii]MCY9434165.1 hypothetical protein [Bacillus haynesii]MEC0754601.1 hypothetical protein [Bacillus haynesii]